MVQRGDGAGFALEAFTKTLRETLMATTRSSRVSRAFHTTPMRLRRGRQKLIGPSLSPAASGITIESVYSY